MNLDKRGRAEEGFKISTCEKSHGCIYELMQVL